MVSFSCEMHTEFSSKNGSNISDLLHSPAFAPSWLLPLSALPLSSINASPSLSLKARLKCYLFSEASPVPLSRMNASCCIPLNLSKCFISGPAPEGCTVYHSDNDKILKYLVPSVNGTTVLRLRVRLI